MKYLPFIFGCALFINVGTPTFADWIRFCPYSKTQIKMDHCIKFTKQDNQKVLSNNCGRTVNFHYCELSAPASNPDSCAASGKHATKWFKLRSSQKISFSVSETMMAWPHICQ